MADAIQELVSYFQGNSSIGVASSFQAWPSKDLNGINELEQRIAKLELENENFNVDRILFLSNVES